MWVQSAAVPADKPPEDTALLLQNTTELVRRQWTRHLICTPYIRPHIYACTPKYTVHISDRPLTPRTPHATNSSPPQILLRLHANPSAQPPNIAEEPVWLVHRSLLQVSIVTTNSQGSRFESLGLQALALLLAEVNSAPGLDMLVATPPPPTKPTTEDATTLADEKMATRADIDMNGLMLVVGIIVAVVVVVLVVLVLVVGAVVLVRFLRIRFRKVNIFLRALSAINAKGERLRRTIVVVPMPYKTFEVDSVEAVHNGGPLTIPLPDTHTHTLNPNPNDTHP